MRRRETWYDFEMKPIMKPNEISRDSSNFAILYQCKQDTKIYCPFNPNVKFLILQRDILRMKKIQ